MTTYSRVIKSLLGVCAITTFALMGAAVPANAAASTASGPITGTWTGVGGGLADVAVDSANKKWPAWTYTMNISDKSVETYCVQFTAPIDETGPYTATSWAASKIAGLSQAQDIAQNHSDIGVPFDDTKWEKAATQAAIWTFTSGLDYTKIPNTEMRDRISDILAGVDEGVEPASVINMSATGAAAVNGKANVVVNLSTNLGPVANTTVSVAFGNSVFTGTTGTDGKATVSVDTAGLTTTTGVVSSEVLVGPGTILAPAAGQAMMTSSQMVVTRVTDVTLTGSPTASPSPTSTGEASPSPTATVDPTTTAEASPAPTSTATPDALPNTGSSVAPWMALGALTIAGVGAGGYWYSRRSRGAHE